MTETIDPQPILYVVCGIGVVASVVFFVVQHLRRAKKPAEVAAAPQPLVPALPIEKPCPCGAAPTRPLPRAKMRDLWVMRWWRRTIDAFAPPEVCEACGRYADAMLDERMADTVRLARARVETEIAREMAAHERALLGAVVDALPEEARRAWARIQRPPALPTVRALPRTTDDGAEEKTA